MKGLSKKEAEERGILTTRRWHEIREHEVLMDIERVRDSRENVPLMEQNGTEKVAMGVNEEELQKIDRKVRRGRIKNISMPLPFEYMIANGRLRGNYTSRAYTYDEMMAAYYAKPSPAGYGYRWQLYHYLVKRVLQEEGAMTAKEIQERTGIPRRSLYRILETLEKIHEVDSRVSPSEGGRPAKEYFVPPGCE